MTAAEAGASTSAARLTPTASASFSSTPTLGLVAAFSTLTTVRRLTPLNSARSSSVHPRCSLHLRSRSPTAFAATLLAIRSCLPITGRTTPPTSTSTRRGHASENWTPSMALAEVSIQLDPRHLRTCVAAVSQPPRHGPRVAGSTRRPHRRPRRATAPCARRESRGRPDGRGVHRPDHGGSAAGRRVSGDAGARPDVG